MTENERGPSPGPSHVIQDRSPHLSEPRRRTPRPGLRPFLYRVVARDGSESTAIFYATTPAIATGYARQWAQRFGFRVELTEAA